MYGVIYGGGASVYSDNAAVYGRSLKATLLESGIAMLAGSAPPWLLPAPYAVSGADVSYTTAYLRATPCPLLRACYAVSATGLSMLLRRVRYCGWL